MGKILVILGETPFQSEIVDHTLKILRAARQSGHDASLFLFMDGVYNMTMTQRGDLFKTVSITKELEALSKMGVRIMCCKLCTELRGIGGTLKPGFVEETGVGELNEEISEADSVLSFLGVS